MEKFQLSVLFKIIGVGSASGLLYHNDLLYIISDSSTYLYEYDMTNENLNKIALVENPQENSAKKDKPDFEAISLKGNDIIVLGSGSTEKRNHAVFYNVESCQTKEKDLSELYQRIKDQLHFKDEELNIEGLIIDQKDIYLFQRGNGVEGKNGIIYVYNTKKDSKLTFTPIDLPKINAIATTFTDAILVDDKIYFLAAAEDTSSTYNDGEVLGSIIGSIDLKTLKLESHFQISDNHKFEGLTLFKKTATELEFLLCEDNDTEELATSIYKLIIK